MNRFERGSVGAPEQAKDDSSDDELEYLARRSGILEQIGRARVRRLITEAAVFAALSSAVPEKQAGADLEAPEGERIELSADAVYFETLNNFDSPDYSSKSPDWDDQLSFEFQGNDWEMTRRDLTLAIDNRLFELPTRESNDSVVGEIFDQQFNYYIPLDNGKTQAHTNAFALDIMYGVNVPDTVELLDVASGTSAKERDELGRILSSQSYAFLPEGMVPEGTLITKQRVGEEVLKQYLPQKENRNAYLLNRFNDSSELVLGMMRDVNWSELKGRDRENFRAISAWIVRAEINFSTDFVQIADHVLHSDQADKEAHLFESITSWGNGKEIPSVLERARANQADFNNAVDAYVKFVDEAKSIDPGKKAELKQRAEEYRTKVLDWQNEELGDLFERKVDLEKMEDGEESKDATKWRSYKADYLDGYTADKS